jgi:hypothetical protein
MSGDGLNGHSYWAWSPSGAIQVSETSAITDWTSIASRFHVCGIRPSGLFCYGANLAGEVGDGTRIKRDSPVQVGSATDWTKVQQ